MVNRLLYYLVQFFIRKRITCLYVLNNILIYISCIFLLILFIRSIVLPFYYNDVSDSNVVTSVLLGDSYFFVLCILFMILHLVCLLNYLLPIILYNNYFVWNLYCNLSIWWLVVIPVLLFETYILCNIICSMCVTLYNLLCNMCVTLYNMFVNITNCPIVYCSSKAASKVFVNDELRQAFVKGILYYAVGHNNEIDMCIYKISNSDSETETFLPVGNISEYYTGGKIDGLDIDYTDNVSKFNIYDRYQIKNISFDEEQYKLHPKQDNYITHKYNKALKSSEKQNGILVDTTEAFDKEVKRFNLDKDKRIEFIDVKKELNSLDKETAVNRLNYSEQLFKKYVFQNVNSKQGESLCNTIEKRILNTELLSKHSDITESMTRKQINYYLSNSFDSQNDRDIKEKLLLMKQTKRDVLEFLKEELKNK